MVKKQKDRWRLSRNEVECFGSASTSTNRNKLPRASRAVDDRSYSYELTHISTKISVEGEIP
jgi:hypothetical protein